ncbi:MAG: hypothetical protein Q9211_003059 [Gyalolechia sp. 1 TL-2023]
MASSRTKKKRHVSRPRSPTHKRPKPAPPLYDQTTGDPQQAVKQEAAQSSVLQRSLRSTITDHVPHLPRSGLEQLSIEDDVPFNQLFANGVAPYQDLRGSSANIRRPVRSQAEVGMDVQILSGSSTLPSHSGPLPGAVFRMGTEAAHEPFTQIKPRKSAVQHGKGLVTRSPGKIAVEENFTSNSRNSSLSSKISASSSPLNLGSRLSHQISPSLLQSPSITSDSRGSLDSKVSDQTFPSILKSSGIISDSTGALNLKVSTNTSDSDVTRLSKRIFSGQRLTSGYSKVNKPSERSSCPSPSPSFRYDAGNPGAYAKSKKGVLSTFNVAKPTSRASRIRRLIPMEKVQGDQEKALSPDVLPGDLVKMYDEQSPTDVDTEQQVSLALTETNGSCSRSSSRPSSSSSVEPAPQILTKTEHTRFSLFSDMMAGAKDQSGLFLEFWRDAYEGQFAAPEPLRVFPALTGNEITQGRNDNDGFDRETDGQNEPSNPSGSSTYLSLVKWRFPTGVSSHEVQEEIPLAPQHAITPTGNSSGQGTEHKSTQAMSRVSGIPAHVPGLDGDAPSVDPSLEAGVYHHLRPVTSSTTEPELEPELESIGEDQVMPPGLTPDEINEGIVGRNLAEEIHERQESPREEHERQRKQHNAEGQQSESIQEWMASTPPRRSRGMTVQPGRLRETTNTDAAGCWLCQCLTPLRSLCCGRKRDGYDAMRICRGRARSRDPLTEDRLHEHMRAIGQPQISGRGSTTVPEEIALQRQ